MATVTTVFIGSALLQLAAGSPSGATTDVTASSSSTSSTGSPPIPKRIRWFVDQPSKMASSQFLAQNSDLVSGYYYCCFPLYVSGGSVCEGKHCQKNIFDVAGVNALRATNRTVHVALAGASGAVSADIALRDKEKLAAQLVSTAHLLPQSKTYNTSTTPINIQAPARFPQPTRAVISLHDTQLQGLHFDGST